MAGEVAEESLAGIRTVRSFAAEENEARRYGAAVARALGLARRRILAGATFMAVASFAGYSAAVLVFWYGGRLVVQGQMTVGALTSFLVYTLIVAFSLGGLADLWADFMRAAGAAERVFELIDRVPAMPEPGRAGAAAGGRAGRAGRSGGRALRLPDAPGRAGARGAGSSTWRPGRWWRWSGPRGRASPPSPR